MAREAPGNPLQIRIASGINLLAGLWLVAYYLVLVDPVAGEQPWNQAIPGMLIALMAGYRIARPYATRAMAWMNVLLGLWLIIAPFIWGYYSFAPGHTWNSIIPGVIVVAAGTWSALSGGRAREV